MSNVRPHLKYDPDIVYHSESPAFIRGVRLVCGALFGLLPGFWLVAHFYPMGAVAVAVTFGASVASCAALAAYCGDSFWHRVGQVIRSNFFV
jgi:hypothetical protein